MRKLQKPAALLTAVLAGALVLTACSAASAATSVNKRALRTSAVEKGGVVRWAEAPGASPDYIDPVGTYPGAGTNNNILDFQPLMYQPLWSPNFNEPTFNYADSIGNKPVWSHGDTEVTITLKHYMWSNGTPVTTRDISFYFNVVKGGGSEWASYNPNAFPYNVKRVIVSSPTKISFVLDRSYNPTYYLAEDIYDIIPLPQNVWDRTSINGKVGNYDETPAGAKAVFDFLNSYAESPNTYSSTNKIWGDVDGPYELKSFGGDAAPTIFVPNPRYSGHRSTISKFEELPFTSDAAEYNVLRSGTSALTVGYVPLSDVPTLSGVRSAGFDIAKVYPFGFTYIIPNLANPKLGATLSQLYVRQALQHLMNQPEIIKDFFHGYGSPTYGPAPLYPLGNKFVDNAEKHNLYPYSVKRAESLLSAHGWKIIDGIQTCESLSKCGKGVKRGTKLDLSLLYTSGSTELTEEDELYQGDAALAHIRVTLKNESAATVGGIMVPCDPKDPTEPQCTWQLGNYTGMTYTPELYPAGWVLFLPGAALNAGSYDNPTINRLINQIPYSATLQPYYEYETLVATQLPWIWQPTEDTIAAIAKNLHGPGLTNEFGNLSPNLWYYTR